MGTRPSLACKGKFGVIASAGENKGTSCHQSLIDELEASISQRNIGSRAEILRQTTDLFVAGSGYFDNKQMALFDDVMNRLVNEIDHSARVTFGETLGQQISHRLKSPERSL